VRELFNTIILLFTSGVLISQPTANAGADFTICPGESRILGGTPPVIGGVPPYSFTWSPSAGLNNPNLGNPTVTANSNMQYTLTAQDSNGDISSDEVTIFIDDLVQYTAGTNTDICLGSATGVPLGHPSNSLSIGYGFSWQPAAGLDNSNAPNPLANPSSTTIYSLTVSHGTCVAQTGTVLVTVIVLPIALAFNDTTINEGSTITLLASGANNYSWLPQNSFIKYANTGTPDVNPLKTTTYTVTAVGDNGCIGQDTVRVTVVPFDDPIFYSAFTPNGDGDNDFFFIGNLQKYPDNVLKIYNRYGQVIFTSAGYNNDWDGSYQGNKVPTGTYFFIFESGSDKGRFKGSVSILR